MLPGYHRLTKPKTTSWGGPLYSMCLFQILSQFFGQESAALKLPGLRKWKTKFTKLNGRVLRCPFMKGHFEKARLKLRFNQPYALHQNLVQSNWKYLKQNEVLWICFPNKDKARSSEICKFPENSYVNLWNGESNTIARYQPFAFWLISAPLKSAPAAKYPFLGASCHKKSAAWCWQLAAKSLTSTCPVLSCSNPNE